MADEVKGAAGKGVDERVKSLEEALSLEKGKRLNFDRLDGAGTLSDA